MLLSLRHYSEATPPLFVQGLKMGSDIGHDNNAVLDKFRSYTRQWLREAGKAQPAAQTQTACLGTDGQPTGTNMDPDNMVRAEVQADCICIVYLCVPVCYRGQRRTLDPDLKAPPGFKV